MGESDEVEKLPYIIQDALLGFAKYVLKNEPSLEQYSLEAERQTKRICNAISEAGYICVAKGDEPLSEDFGEAMLQVLEAERDNAGRSNTSYIFPLCHEEGVAVKPEIVCLCGSTRFVDKFNEWRGRLTLEGKIVVGIELAILQSEADDPQHSNYPVKKMLDELHLRKIDLADRVMVLNVEGYIGESTRREIEYAKQQGKPIDYLQQREEGDAS